MALSGRVRRAGPAFVNRAKGVSAFRVQSSRSLRCCSPEALARRARRFVAIAITARRAGALLTGLATALAVGSRRSGVAITAPKAGAILSPSAALQLSANALAGRILVTYRESTTNSGYRRKSPCGYRHKPFDADHLQHRRLPDDPILFLRGRHRRGRVGDAIAAIDPEDMR